MRAVRKQEAAPGVRIEEVPVPAPGPTDLLVEVRATSVCGTDYHIFAWDRWAAGRVRPPLTVGHEFAGSVVAVGREVTSVRVGDAVSAETHLVCNVCPRCRSGEFHLCERTRILGVDADGAFAQYVVIPEQNAWVNDPDIPFPLQSIQEPLGNAVHTVLAGEIAGQSVAVIGCGPIGIMSVPVAKMCGAEIVIAVDVNDYRLGLARTLGADLTVNPRQQDLAEAVRAATRGYGADVVLEMSGNERAIADGIRAARNGARVSLLGLPPAPVTLDLANEVVMRGLTLQGITGRQMWKTWYQVRSLYRAGLAERLKPLITHTFALDQVEDAMELMRTGQCGKAVLLPNQTS
jgi:threonine 3-dehydrogenase